MEWLHRIQWPVYSYNNFLSVTPDDVVVDTGIIEVKCPSSAFVINAEDAIIRKEIDIAYIRRQKEFETKFIEQK